MYIYGLAVVVSVPPAPSLTTCRPDRHPILGHHHCSWAVKIFGDFVTLCLVKPNVKIRCWLFHVGK